MALRIPIYDQPQVQSNAQPVPQIRGGAPNLGAALGQGLEQAAGVAHQLAVKAREAADNQTLLEKQTQFRNLMNQNLQKMQSLQGMSVYQSEAFGGEKGQSFSDHSERQHEQAIIDMTAGMRPELAQRFRESVQPLATSYAHAARNHEYQQMKVVQAEEYGSSRVSMKNTAVLAVGANGSINDDLLKGVLAQADGVIESHLSSNGVPPEAREIEKQKFKSDVVASTIKSLMAKSNSTDAQRLLKEYGPMMTPEDRQKLEDGVKEVNDRNLGYNAAFEKLEKYRGASGATNLEAALKELHTEFKDNPAAFSIAQAQLTHLAEARQKTYIGQENAVANDIMALMSKGKDPGDVNRAIDQALSDGAIDGTSAATLKDRSLTWFHKRATMGREMNAEAYTVRMAEFILNPKQLVSTPDKTILGMTDLVGPHGVLQLAQMKAQLMQPNAADLRIDDDDFKMVAFDNGLIDKNGKPVEKFASRISVVKSEVERRIAQESQKGPLSREQKMAIARQVAAPVERDVQGTFWDSTVKQPDAMFTPEQKDYDASKKLKVLGPEELSTLKLYLQTRGFTQGQIERMRPNDLLDAYKEYESHTPLGRTKKR
jgi:hypothetical protein